MKIGIVSDTHYNNTFLTKVVKFFKEEESVVKVYHLGDEWDDLKVLDDEGIDYKAVPGIFAEQYKDESIANQIVDEVNGVKVLLTHDLSDLYVDGKPTELIKDNDVILFGHTHSYELKYSLGKLFLNPGHLKEEYHKDRVATFAVMSINATGDINAKIYDINFNYIAEISRSLSVIL